MDEDFLHDEPKRQQVVKTCPAGMQPDACSMGVAGDGGHIAMDASQCSTTPASGSPQRAEVEPQPIRQEMAHMSFPLQVGENCPQPSPAGNEQKQAETVARQGAEHQALLGRLAGTLSHEIRNPCNSIFLHMDLLEEELQQLPPASRVQMVESVVEIKSEVTRLHDMMQDYLTLARLADLQKQPEELGSLVEGLSMEMYEACAARGITLHLEGLEGLGSVVIHKTTLRHALCTLIHQAIGVMPAGGTLTLRGRQEGPTAHLEVSTTGPGLPEEELSRVFEPWHTLHPEGPGLGLYVARAIVVAHGGTLTVQSPSGHGTSFTMTLPGAEGV